MSAAVWRIPPSTTQWLADVPAEAPVAVLLRHSVRGPLPPGEAGDAVPLTGAGVGLARRLGAMLGDRLSSLHASPLRRCMETAEALRSGAGVDVPVVADSLLGDPGVFVADARLAWSNWQTLGHEGVMRRLMAGSGVMPGMADPEPAARHLLRHMLAVAGQRAGLHLFVTHDSVISAAVARLLGKALEKDRWPRFLEGAFFWRRGGHVVTAYRDSCSRSEAAVAVDLDERSVVDFARREAARVVGTGCRARFVLAGGAFKTLITGRSPRDLDLWAPSPRDRELLKIALAERGAVRLDARRFAEAFAVDGRTVELPYKTEPDTLEGLLERFDIALSGVGVEHEPGDRWRAVVHPLARTSIAREQVLLLKPLVNREWALATLERLRRYADELQYSVPPTEEAAIWRVFEAQSDRMKRRMLGNFDGVTEGGYGVREEALCRFLR